MKVEIVLSKMPTNELFVFNKIQLISIYTFADRMFKIRSLLINMINKKINMLRDLNFYLYLYVLLFVLMLSWFKSFISSYY